MLNIGIIRINLSFKNWIWVFLDVKDLLFMCFILVKKFIKKRKLNIWLWMVEMLWFLLYNVNNILNK